MQTTLLDWQNHIPATNCLENKIILITGAADGIGKAVSVAAAKHGATVILLDKKTRHLEKVYDSIVAQGSAEPVMLPFDLLNCTPDAAQTIANGVIEDFGHLDGLLHNAAELGSPSPMDQYDFEYWQKVMHTNLQAPYFLTRMLLPALNIASSATTGANNNNPQLLFTSDQSGRTPSAYSGAYGIAYGGLEAQMRVWADELENTTNIKINSIDPGPIRTAFRRRSHPGESQDQLIPPQAITKAYLKLFAGDHSHHGEALRLQDL